MTDLIPKLLPARTIPVPSTASPELQRAISASADVAYDARLRIPQNTEQWKRMVAASDALTLQRIAEILERFPADVEVREVSGVAVRAITPRNLDPVNATRLLIHLHGGAYVISGGEASVPEGILMAHYARTPVLSVDYRMPPDHPFPAALDDTVAVWKQLLTQHAPERMAVFGTSAGGGLALAMMLKLKELGLPLPAALAPGTPWADLAGKSDSYATNAFIDGVLPFYQGTLQACAQLYAGRQSLDHPLVSPVHGDFSGFPPSILTTGTRDILLSDTVRVYRKMRAAGVHAQLEVHEAMSHAEYAYVFDSLESKTVFTEIAAFIDRHLQR